MSTIRDRNPGQGKNILNQVSEGMDVYDVKDDKVGSVRRIYLGEVSDEAEDRGAGPATVSEEEDFRRGTIVDTFQDVFAPDTGLDDTVRARLYREGFLLIEGSGILSGDYYVSPNQITEIRDDTVRLEVPKDKLLKN